MLAKEVTNFETGLKFDRTNQPHQKGRWDLDFRSALQDDWYYLFTYKTSTKAKRDIKRIAKSFPKGTEFRVVDAETGKVVG